MTRPPAGTPEHCQRCDDEVAIDWKGRVGAHQRICSWSWQMVGNVSRRVVSRAPDLCEKSGRPSKEEKQRRADASWEGRKRKVEELRGAASVLLDAVIEGQEHKFTEADISEMIQAAVDSFRVEHPRSRIETPYKIGYRQGPRGGRMVLERCDVYCLFCGLSLLQNVSTRKMAARARLKADGAPSYVLRWHWLYRPEVSRHLLGEAGKPGCALLCLAGMKKIAAPRTKIIPENLGLDDWPPWQAETADEILSDIEGLVDREVE
jgi:hypothetical protein